MMAEIQIKQRKIKKYLLVLPIIMIILIAGGAYLGIQLSKTWGTSNSIIWPIFFATIGFGISIIISIFISKIIATTK